MSKRIDIVSEFYGSFDEDSRVDRTRAAQLEYRTTMEYIRRHAAPGCRILEVGAGTGRYSIALARAGFEVTALELVPHNLRTFQGDALDLSQFSDGEFDLTLVLGPMYHLYDPAEVRTALSEALRVTKPGGTAFFAFLSVHAILSNNYLQGDLQFGLRENFTADHRTRHFPEQLFTGYDIAEFEALFASLPAEHLTTAAADGILELASRGRDFSLSDADFEAYARYHLATCEKRELLGWSSHLLYICRKC